jgi:hypothetical protein
MSGTFMVSAVGVLAAAIVGALILRDARQSPVPADVQVPSVVS